MLLKSTRKDMTIKFVTGFWSLVKLHVSKRNEPKAAHQPGKVGTKLVAFQSVYLLRKTRKIIEIN